MLDQVYFCRLCGNSSSLEVFHPDCLDLPNGVALSVLCRQCDVTVSRTIGWELAHSLLRKSSRDFRFRLLGGSYPWLWRACLNIDAMGVEKRACIRTQVRDAWAEIFPPMWADAILRNSSTVEGYREWQEELAKQEDIIPLIRLILSTLGEPSITLSRQDYVRSLYLAEYRFPPLRFFGVAN
jgi:hypothetical protein